MPTTMAKLNTDLLLPLENFTFNAQLPTNNSLLNTQAAFSWTVLHMRKSSRTLALAE